MGRHVPRSHPALKGLDREKVQRARRERSAQAADIDGQIDTLARLILHLHGVELTHGQRERLRVCSDELDRQARGVA